MQQETKAQQDFQIQVRMVVMVEQEVVCLVVQVETVVLQVQVELVLLEERIHYFTIMDVVVAETMAQVRQAVAVEPAVPIMTLQALTQGVQQFQ